MRSARRSLAFQVRLSRLSSSTLRRPCRPRVSSAPLAMSKPAPAVMSRLSRRSWLEDASTSMPPFDASRVICSAEACRPSRCRAISSRALLPRVTVPLLANRAFTAWRASSSCLPWLKWPPMAPPLVLPALTASSTPPPILAPVAFWVSLAALTCSRPPLCSCMSPVLASRLPMRVPSSNRSPPLLSCTWPLASICATWALLCVLWFWPWSR
ncbi:hypothetical protein D3C85_1319620 [compost metagenome]